MRSRSTCAVLISASVAVVLLALAAPAQAAFPGANGKIAFTSTRDAPGLDPLTCTTISVQPKIGIFVALGSAGLILLGSIFANSCSWRLPRVLGVISASRPAPRSTPDSTAV